MLLLDTNVVSELRKVKSGKADKNVARWAETLDPLSLYLSAISVQELETGVGLVERRDQVQGSILREWFEGHVLPVFEGRILPVDIRVAKVCGGMHVPDPRSIRDSLIAATAKVHGL